MAFIGPPGRAGHKVATLCGIDETALQKILGTERNIWKARRRHDETSLSPLNPGGRAIPLPIGRHWSETKPGPDRGEEKPLMDALQESG